MARKAEPALAPVKLTVKQKIELLIPYVKRKIVEQIQAVALIVTYLVLFQVFILGIPIAEATTIAFGIAVIVIGLAFFMEGLFLGLMPLGETIGIRLPQKSKLLGILLFAFALGVGVTLAEPAIGVLQVAGGFIRAWDAPLLFLLLNRNAQILVYAVGTGVGVAVVFGMLRFMYNWSLKPYIFILVPVLTAFSIWAFLDPNLQHLLSLAWDAGAVTTGPVTVPLVLALGLGITRVVSKGDSEGGGFGVVTLASLFPIYAVLILGVVFRPAVPAPMEQAQFFSTQYQEQTEFIFGGRTEKIAYALKNADVRAQQQIFGGSQAELLSYVERLKTDTDLRRAIFGRSDIIELERWAIQSGSPEQRLVVFGDDAAVRAAVARFASAPPDGIDASELVIRNGMAAVQAILPLSVFLLIVLTILLREKLPRADEVFVGLTFAVLGMFLFNVGIELGLSRLGNQVGSMVPASFTRVELGDQATTIRNFDEGIVQTAIRPDGTPMRFFYANINGGYVQVPFETDRLDSSTNQYRFVPFRGPLFGGDGDFSGYLVVLLFAFVMGYGATLAEPALNALGATVEILTVGAFKKSLLMQAVAIGVGLGIMTGLIKVIWNIPLIVLVAPPYMLLMLLTALSSEQFVNIGWDSAGVTTGPITVPLVLALGLGLSGQVGAVEGFGILASASVFPILSVLTVGLVVNTRKKAQNKIASSAA